MTPEELYENFSFLTDWEDKYRYLIELGDNLPPFSDIDKTEQNKVDGCLSQVWMTAEKKNDKYIFHATSDAHIVRGLIAILLTLVNDKTAKEILALDIPAVFRELGLEEHLSPTRRNGFFAMTERIHNIANKD